MNQPQSSQSAIQEQTAAQNTAGTEESDRTVVPGSQSDRDGEADQTEEVTAVSQKDRTFLRVPSRSSSNKVQPSPTSTGLSGVTANDTRTSLGGRSKESNQSGLERRRDGSAGSSKMSISQPGQSTGAQNPQPSPHVTPKPPKKRFLSFLNCCSAPDDANTPDTDEGKLEANKVTKAPIPGRPVTASTPEALRVEQQTSQGGQFTNEKLPLPADSAQDLKAAATKAQPGGDGQPGTDGAVASPTVNVSEPPLPELPKEAESTSAGPSKEESAQTVILHQADFTIPVEIEGQYHNVYVIKRPGVDEFMKRVGELYEVVVFTASVSKGNYVKDLSQVGRDLKETIIIDNSPTSYIFHPQHAVPISSWFSDAHDNELLDLIPVLEDLAGSQVRDVSLVLDVAL
ncbi:hypothetical protein DH86_00002204 [Scytalidium sp. 3C]|nr:hypothetical protein DH86_00002204 [Scytalidium sp. 3C]